MLGELLIVALLATAGNATIDGVYPNPATADDVGEFVVLDLPESTTSPLVLSDGEDRVTLSPPLPAGRVAVAWEPDQARTLTDLPVIAVNDSLALSNDGERLVLLEENRTISTLEYPAAPEAERYRNGSWRPLGRTDFEPARAANVSVSAFVLPDNPSTVESVFDSADERLLVGGYTLTDPSVTDRLVAASERGVEVQVLLEGGPVGGFTTATGQQVETLRQAGVTVQFVGGDRARYAYHHAKYVIADDRLLVTSENWKPGGTGGNGSRGWGIVVEDPRLASEMATVFRADIGWKDTTDWNRTEPEEVQPSDLDDATYPRRFEPGTMRANRTTLLLAPDNAHEGVRSLLRSADRSIWIEQVSVQPDGMLANETIAAARRGVEVRILLSGEWYVEDENRQFAGSLRKRAAREDLPIRVRLVEPRRRFEHVHAKGVVVDHRTVVVGSLNWNDHALHENREVLLRVDDSAVAAHFERVYMADWRGAAWRIQWGLVGAVVLATLSACWYGLKIATFERSP